MLAPREVKTMNTSHQQINESGNLAPSYTDFRQKVLERDDHVYQDGSSNKGLVPTDVGYKVRFL